MEVVESELNGYNELANDANLKTFTISEYNTDDESIPNIQRPDKSEIINSSIPTTQLFGIWVQDPSPETPHATFKLTEKSFYVVDYDGDGAMPYIINGDSITVYYNDFVLKGILLPSKEKEQLTIHWNNSKKPTVYYVWKN